MVELDYHHLISPNILKDLSIECQHLLSEQKETARQPPARIYYYLGSRFTKTLNLNLNEPTTNL